ncbi:MAG TPA: hypothetical protein VGC32_08025 [Solirubrobacterales bacterium]
MRRAIATALAALALALLLPTLAAAGETSPYYPGSTLSVKLAARPKPGKVTTLIASGQDTPGDVGFGLEMFAKPASEDPTCMGTYEEELNSSIDEPGESLIYQGVSAEGGGPFKLLIKAKFNPVKVVVCAYSVYVTDTAANARLAFAVPAAKAPHRKPRHQARATRRWNSSGKR